MWGLALALLGTANAAPPILPLAVGNTWTYEVRVRTGGGVRVLFRSSAPATNIKTQDWVFAITEQREDAYFATFTRTPTDPEGLATTSTMMLWEKDGQVWTDAGGERLAIEALIPPGAVSSERVACVAHILDNLMGSCAPHPGGPLGTSPGLHDGLIGAHGKPGASLAQIFVGIATVGTIIPGNKSSSERATLTSFTAGPDAEIETTPSKLLSAIRSGNRSPRQVAKLVTQHKATAEEVAAAITLFNQADDVLVAVLPALAMEDRYPVLRTAIGQSDNRITTLARASQAIENRTEGPQFDALLAAFSDQGSKDKATLILSGEAGLFVAMLSEDSTFDDDVHEVLVRELPNHPVTVQGALPILGLFSFDDGRSGAIELLLTTLPEEERAGALLVWVPALTFDDAKIELMTAHVEALKTLSIEDRKKLVADSSFKKDEVTALLGL